MPAANNSMFDRHASVDTKRRLTTVSTVLVPRRGDEKCFRRFKIPSPCPEKIDNRSTYVHMLFVGLYVQ